MLPNVIEARLPAIARESRHWNDRVGKRCRLCSGLLVRGSRQNMPGENRRMTFENNLCG